MGGGGGGGGGRVAKSRIPNPIVLILNNRLKVVNAKFKKIPKLFELF